MVSGCARIAELALSSLVTLGGSAAKESSRRYRFSRDPEDHVDQGPQSRPVLLPPLLQTPGGPEHVEPVRARRDSEDHGVLAAARRLRIPHGRRAVSDSE